MPAVLCPMPKATEGPNDQFINTGFPAGIKRLIEQYIDRQQRLVPGSRKISYGEAVRRLVVSGLIREQILSESDADDPPLT